MRILFVNNKYKLFGEADSGASNRSTMFLRALASMGHVDVVSFVKVCTSNIPNCDVIYSEDILDTEMDISPLRKIKRALFSKDIKELYGTSYKKTEIIRSLVVDRNYDFVACRYINEAAICSLCDYSSKLIIDVDDSPKQALLQSISQRSCILKKIYIQWYAKTIEKVCEGFLETVHSSFYSNPTEKPSDKSVFLHNVTISTTSIEDLPKDFAPIILLVGWMVYSPNKLGAIHFARKVFPLIKEKIPDAQFRIAGKYEGTFKDDLECNKGVKVLGFVPNIDEEYTNSAIVVVPIYQGSGTSIKVIEALQKNRPVVSTPMGIRGLENILVDGEDYLEADSDEQFARIIIKLLKSDPTKLISLAHNGNSKARKYFSQEKFIKIVNQTVLRK
jgi:glycosyltransferase involved in cell wall biosynthesis